MKKIFLLIVILVSSLLLECKSLYYNLSWNYPEISSRTHSSFLEKNQNENRIIEMPDSEVLINNSKLDFVLSSGQNFIHSWQKFLFYKNDDSSFLYYRTPDKIKTKPTSSRIHPNRIPLKSRLKISLFSGFDLAASKKDRYYFIYNGLKLSGYIQKRLFFYSNVRLGHFAGDMDYARTSKLIDSWTQNSDDGEKIYLDNVVGKISYQGRPDFWSVSLGRGKFEIGNNVGGSVILNDDCNEYGYFSNQFKFHKLRISFLHASLIPDSTASDSYKDYSDKYLVIHKIDWNPHGRFHLFFGEEVIYGNRSIDPSYLLPHTLMRPIEHNLRDRDNVLIFLGMNYKPITWNTLYMNFIFDELSKSKIFTSWWGNKYAVQVGNSLKLNPKIRFTTEFTAVRPWIYTHKDMVDKFSHDGIGLGFPEGSNLLQVCSELNLQLMNNLAFDINASYTKQGSVGNDFSINYESRPSDTANWLEGDISKTIISKAVFSWQPLAHHKIKLGYEMTKIDEQKATNEFMISYQAFY